MCINSGWALQPRMGICRHASNWETCTDEQLLVEYGLWTITEPAPVQCTAAASWSLPHTCAYAWVAAPLISSLSVVHVHLLCLSLLTYGVLCVALQAYHAPDHQEECNVVDQSDTQCACDQQASRGALRHTNITHALRKGTSQHSMASTAHQDTARHGTTRQLIRSSLWPNSSTFVRIFPLISQHGSWSGA